MTSARGVVAVVTVVHGRHHHLRRQHASLVAAPPTARPDHWVVVAVDDDAVGAWNPQTLAPDVVTVPTTPLGLPLAAARNVGARRAANLGADVVVFLDVDCLAALGLVAGYRDAARSEAGVVWCGPVSYLPPPPPGGYDLRRLADLDRPHPARPAPRLGQRIEADGDWLLFWSLSFATRVSDFERAGGFDEAYAGYGGEDTDFGQRARRTGLRLTWLGDARAYHQYHPVGRPPVEHAADIVRNARVFHDRWGWWPMAGWLEELREAGVVRQVNDVWETAS